MVEMIGFIISLLALFYIFIKQSLSPQQRGSATRYQESRKIEDDPFTEFLKGIEEKGEGRESVEQRAPPPSKKRGESKKKSFRSVDEHRSRVSNAKSSLEIQPMKSKFLPHEKLPNRILVNPLLNVGEKHEQLKPSRAKSVVRRLSHRRDLIIYREIMDKPKSLRSDIFSL